MGSARLKIIVEHTFLGKRGREKRKEERANLLLSLPPPPPPPPRPLKCSLPLTPEEDLILEGLSGADARYTK